jgi:multiple sugar transport system substrate-binding protein
MLNDKAPKPTLFLEKPRRGDWSRRDFMRTAGQAAGAALLGGSAIALMACEKKPPAQKTARSVHLLQWSNFVAPADEELRRQAKEFESQTGVTVTVETINANDLNARATAAVESKRGPDIIQLQWNQAHLYEGGLMNVDEVSEELGKPHGGWYETAVAAAKVGDHFKAIPYNIVGNAIAYRRDKFDELGIGKFPDTWPEYLEVGRKLKKAGMPVGQTLGHTFGDAPTWCYPLLWSFGGHELSEDGRSVALNTPQAVEAVKFMKEFWKAACDEGGLAWDDTSNNRAFLAGTIGASLNGASIYFVPRMNPQQYPGLAEKIDHALLPKGPGGRFHLPVNFQHGIMDYSENKEAAIDFVRFLMQKENFEKWFVICNGYSLGAGPAWASHDLWTKDPRLTVYRDMAKYGRLPGWPGPFNRLASEVQAKYIIVDLFAKAVQGTDTAESAVSWAEKELQNVYQRA